MGLVKYAVVGLAVIGFANFTVINHQAFQNMSKTIITQKGKNIPKRLLNDVVSHHWRLTPEKKEKKS